MNYDEYLKSDYWLNLRKERLNLDCNMCQTCGEISNLEIHHKYEGPPNFSYKSSLGNEKVNDDLITLCTWCHEAITSSVRKRRFSSIVDPNIQGVYDVKDISNSGNQRIIDAQSPAFRPIK